jgi:hypothetical protein
MLKTQLAGFGIAGRLPLAIKPSTQGANPEC